jgi:hypothetical protein
MILALQCRFWASVLCVGSSIVFVATVASAEDKSSDLNRVISAWKTREKKTNSFDFRWWSKRFESGSFNSEFPSLNQANDHQKPDETFIVAYRYLMDGQNRIRQEERGREWSNDKAEFVPREVTQIFDGTLKHTFYMKDRSGFPSLHIGGNNNDTVGKLVWLHPVNMAFRPFGKSTGVFDEKKLSLDDKASVIDGVPMWTLNDGVRIVVVDPERECVPVRCTTVKPGITVDISYAHDEVCGWVPQSWTIKYRGPVGLLVSETSKVQSFAVNKQIADAEFDLDLREGAYVNDYSKQEQYILRPDGTRRLLAPGEFNGKNYRELLQGE